MRASIYQCPVCNKETLDNSIWRLTQIGWICPKCYPLFLKLEGKILAYYYKSLEDKFNEIMRLNKEKLNIIQKHMDNLEEES